MASLSTGTRSKWSLKKLLGGYNHEAEIGHLLT